jgi:valyl-tRNA synthetase
MSDAVQMEKTYDPGRVEKSIYATWRKHECFAATPDDRPRDQRFTIVIPPPNVTGALHLGHALNNTLQDILVRWHRMRGHNTLWLPGTDHAGIATQAVVEKRLKQDEGKSRHDLGRDALVQRIWDWKDQYEKRILSQLELMGCSCDWSRTRFTLDDGLARAVRHTFFKLFKDGLIFRGKRLVNWDTQLQTAVADDEVYHETVKGSFWHFRYAVNDPQPGEPAHVEIATTRPETMIGDTAVAVHPDPVAALEKKEAELRERIAKAPAKERPALQKQYDNLEARRASHIPNLVKLRDMANAGRTLKLPVLPDADQQRDIPLVLDEHADPLLGTGCVKITPAHDHNDYEVGQRRGLPMVNMMHPDGTVNEAGGPYAGLTMAEARKRIVADMEERGFLVSIEDKDIDLGHSDRSKSPVEPYLSDQWFLKMGELADPALAAVTSGKVKFFPERYARSYLDWLGEKRDWCISRQLWWGHRIPVWTARFQHPSTPLRNTDEILRWRDESIKKLSNLLARLAKIGDNQDAYCIREIEDQPSACSICVRTEDAYRDFQEFALNQASISRPSDQSEPVRTIFSDDPRCKIFDEFCTIVQEIIPDPDVLDTWFSSALWPHSTLGWPEDGNTDLNYYYPTSVLITSRDIITLWVVRMVATGLYNMDDIPFDHVYIHTKILDGRGETMSKSKGNGVDPIDIIERYGADALRYTMADMATETQDVRMPVDYVCPHCAALTPQANVVPKGKQPADVHKVKCKGCGERFATQWAPAGLKEELSVARETSEKFEIGRNFCNKLWNSARFCFMNLEGAPCEPLDVAALPSEDRWILAKLDATIRALQAELEEYHYATAIKVLRDFFWDSFCDWYIELTKPRFRDPASAGPTKQILAFVLDQTLRLMSPFLPFITETLWAELNRIAPRRGLPGVAECTGDDILMLAEYPPLEGYAGLANAEILSTFEDIQAAVRGIRDLRSQCNVPPKEPVTVTLKATPEHLAHLATQRHIVSAMTNSHDPITLDANATRPKNAANTVIGGIQIFVHDISDDDAERKRLEKELTGLDQRITGCENKLANEKFVNNARPEVVAAERDRLAEMQKSRNAIQESINDLTR